MLILQNVEKVKLNTQRMNYQKSENSKKRLYIETNKSEDFKSDKKVWD